MKWIALLFAIWFALCLVFYPARSVIYAGDSDIANVSLWETEEYTDIMKIVALPAEFFCDIVGVFDPTMQDDLHVEERKETYIQWFKDWTVVGWIWTIVENITGE